MENELTQNDQANNNTQQTYTPPAPDVNYIELLQQLKSSTVSKDQYNRVIQENKMLAEALVNNQSIDTGESKTQYTEKDIAALRSDLYKINGNITNLEYIRKTLELRQALIDQGERDPFLPNNADYRESEFDAEKAQYIADGLKQMCDYCGNDSALFNSELKRVLR